MSLRTLLLTKSFGLACALSLASAAAVADTAACTGQEIDSAMSLVSQCQSIDEIRAATAGLAVASCAEFRSKCVASCKAQPASPALSDCLSACSGTTPAAPTPTPVPEVKNCSNSNTPIMPGEPGFDYSLSEKLKSRYGSLASGDEIYESILQRGGSFYMACDCTVLLAYNPPHGSGSFATLLTRDYQKVYASPELCSRPH